MANNPKTHSKYAFEWVLLWQKMFERYSTVTDFAKLRGLSTSVPLASAV